MKKKLLSQKPLWFSLTLAVLAVLVAAAYSARPTAASPPPPAEPLTVAAVAAQGNAADNNNLSANFLVVVTDATGAPVPNLVQTDFSIIGHFGPPGQVCGFSNNITFFSNAGTGAYRIRVAPTMCNWVLGDSLAQVRILSGVRQGQAAAMLSIR